MYSMAVRIGPRIETRLDESHRNQLSEILEKRGWTISAFVRQAIEAEQKRLEHEEFKALLKSFRDDPLHFPPWEELKRELTEPDWPDNECEPHSEPT